MAPADGQQIWTEAAGVEADGFYSESSVYWELPFGDEQALVIAPWVASGAGAGPENWRADAVLAYKRALLRTDDGAMALQLGAVWRSDPGEGCGEGGVELRWLGGRSFGEDGRGFVNLELGARAHDGGCATGELDLTLGYRPRENWLAMAQVFTHEPHLGETAVKAQFTLVRFGEDGRGLQFGLRARLDGGEPEPALIIGFWGRPGD